MEKFLKQGFNENILINEYKTFTKNYLGEWAKFGEDITSPKFINNIFKIFCTSWTMASRCSDWIGYT